jgi:hypothetical protein
MILVNKLIIFPFLFAIFPIILLYSDNISEIPIDELTIPIFLAISIIFLSFLFLNYILKSGIKAGIILTFLVAIFFSYGHIFNFLQEINTSNIDFVHQRYVIIPFIIISILGVYFLIKTKYNLSNYRSIFNVISIVMVLFVFFNIVVFNYNDTDVESFNNIIIEDELEKLNLTTNFTTYEKLPNIYHIVLDEYTSDKVLLEDFEFDNSEFYNHLKNSNFVIPKDTLANYPVTEQFMVSTLNMKYLDNQEYNRLQTEKNISDNLVMNFLKQNGYKIIIPYSGYGPHDRFDRSDSNPCSDVLFLKSRFLTELSRTTIVNYFVEKQIEDERRDMQLCSLSKLEESNEEYNKPVYMFAHLFIPHAPYLFDKDGNSVTPQSNKLKGLQGWHNTDGYLNEIQFVNKRMTDIVNRILSESEQSIIIIQGDTGSSILNDPSIDDYMTKRLSILYAIHMPESSEVIELSNISPVNTYRVIFNEIFETELQMLDKQYYWNNGDQIENITDQIK